MSKDIDDVKNSFLKDEYFKLQDQYEDYDRRALQIKGWISAGSIAGFAIEINSKTYNSPTLLIIATISLCFWYLESMWKMFQYSIIDRIRIIEAHFRNDQEILIKNPAPLQIYNWWFRSFSKDEPIYSYEKHRPRSKLIRLWAAGKQTFVHLPYSLIILICIALYLVELKQG
ncbi:MAG: hypothetical protein O9295_14425 [Microcystis sp. LE18-22.4A]|jgi:hypothetical protein|nr:hypothetical protein [Microcystis sp. LE18-22.4A]MCZ8119214.1 hypothetical protein [Microcystis sp. LE18-22.4A]